MDEFSLINSYFAPLTTGYAGAFGLKDDAAVLPSIRKGYEWVVTTDIISENVHFFTHDIPYTIAQKLLRVNLSDLAAKGAVPKFYMLGCVFSPKTKPVWIERFASGLASDNRLFNISLIGGDTVAGKGPLSFALTAFGEVPTGKMLRRNGAKPGDGIYISGTLGDAALGLMMLKNTLPPVRDKAKEFLAKRYGQPQPRLALGAALVEVASASMDISDGLVQDAGHMAAASCVKLQLELAALPLSDAAREAVSVDPLLINQLLSGGDDYELLFTVSPEMQEALETAAAKSSTPIRRIGTVMEGAGVEVLDKNGAPVEVTHKGYRHF